MSALIHGPNGPDLNIPDSVAIKLPVTTTHHRGTAHLHLQGHRSPVKAASHLTGAASHAA